MGDMKKEEPTDADLVRRSKAGDREAFGCLYDRYARVVRAVILAVSADWHAVEDVTQECFLRAFRGLNRLRRPERFGAWLVGIARRTTREWCRSRGRDRHQFVGNSPPDRPATQEELNTLERLEELQTVMAKLATLPERERLAIHAFILQERGAEEVAALLGLSRSGSYALLHRALAHLAALVDPCDSEKQTE